MPTTIKGQNKQYILWFANNTDWIYYYKIGLIWEYKIKIVDERIGCK